MTKKNKLILILLIAIFCVLYITLSVFIAVNGNASTGADDWFFNTFVLGVRCDFWTWFYKIFTYLGSIYALIVVCLLVVIFCKNKKIKLFSAINLAVVSIGNLLIKFILQRPRPSVNIIAETGFSFPSGHTMMSMAFYGLLIYFIIKFCKNKPLKILSSILISVIIVMIAYSRIYLGVHYFTDMIGGFMLGGVILLLTIIFFNIKYKKEKQDLNLKQ